MIILCAKIINIVSNLCSYFKMLDITTFWAYVTVDDLEQ